jgi:hypothetical protein
MVYAIDTSTVQTFATIRCGDRIIAFTTSSHDRINNGSEQGETGRMTWSNGLPELEV